MVYTPSVAVNIKTISFVAVVTASSFTVHLPYASSNLFAVSSAAVTSGAAVVFKAAPSLLLMVVTSGT